MQLKVKDFAAQQGVSESIIYRHIRQHREALGDRVIKKAKATWITDEGQDYIRNLMIDHPVAVADSRVYQEIDELKAENSNLLRQLRAAEKMAAEMAVIQAQLQAAQQQQLLLQKSEDELKEQLSQKTDELIEAREELGAARQEAKGAKEALEASAAENTALRGKYEAMKNRSLWQRIRNTEV